ncbi:LPS export ABC transporter periplasmic protein LptC [Qipengyuania sp. 1NDW9]|uniref:LPS export ABC transporter periplasmic protein LptC n=1 Tax=Qipengyuania xiapuensis TaxID=2867236 RepID=A0ABX8ZV26_9SPHN|nr:LPS export ABC transporter periplasmic protein LptC [Qipengyuania xiapuensis]MBX7491846.1 LPS export ABC transporter periplasmic protein LptC [Qipengyuania xiapuensis]QZD91447.1 LPS export ABC transporter periplasmic protein LptC [Qipengyuania xiapuensis]
MVFRKRRIETQEAKQLRSRRKHFAAPGGSHDKLVLFLSRVLPMGVGVVAALMVITPLSPRGEVSFLLDRNEVAVITERLRVDNALYRGQDEQGRPFSLTAGEAVQRSSAEGIVRMDDLVARMLMEDGPARVSAPGGQYDINEETVAINGTMRMEAADGYRMRASGVSLDLEQKTLEGAGGVEGAIPAGTFSADRLDADLSERRITLSGQARLRMEPGELRMP